MMAVFCGICARRIGSASENDGSWPVTSEWQGFQHYNSRPAITDSCGDCGAILRAIVTKAALKIAARNAERIEPLKRELAAWKEAEKRAEDERRQFELDWRAHQTAKARGESR